MCYLKKKIKQGTVINNGNGENIFKFVCLENQVKAYRIRSSQAVTIYGKRDTKQKVQ